MQLPVLYQDEFLVAIAKPSGLFVHRSAMDKQVTAFALQIVRDQIGQYVYPLHRLDRPTSGVLLFALSQKVASDMGALFTKHKITKTYYAITRGHLTGEGEINHALTEKFDRFGNKILKQSLNSQQAQTDYKSIATATLPIALGRYDSIRYSLIACKPITGRRHQIRRHLAHLRHPIIGDINYGDNKQNPFFAEHFGLKRLMLHAKSVEFIHPITQQAIKISAAIDDAWCQIFKQLKWPIE